MKKRGFTLIEMLVSLGILVVILVMTAGLVNYSAGRVRSAQTKLLTDTIRATFDTINQKMLNANDQVTINGIDVYGFRAYKSGTPGDITNSDMLLIVSSGAASSPKTCTFFGLDTVNKKLKMGQQATCSATTFPILADLTSDLTSDKIQVNSFTITNNYTMTDGNPAQIPSVTIDVSAQDKQDSKNQAELKSTFTMSYDNVNYLKN